MSKDVLLVAVLELHGHRQADEGFILEATVTIAKVHLTGMDFTNVPCFIEYGHARHHILHFAVIGTGVHIRCAADAPRDAAGKFKAAQAELSTGFAHIDEGKTCTGTDGSILNKEGTQALGGNYHTAHALVRNKDVAPFPKHEVVQAFLLADAYHFHELIHAMWKNHRITRATNAEGGVGTEGFVEFHVVFADNEGKEIFHYGISFRFRDSAALRLRRYPKRGNLR